MKCSACKSESKIEFNGFCSNCLDIREEIEKEKLANGEILPPPSPIEGKSCRECHFFKNLGIRHPFTFKCTWNHKIYTTDTPCFGFKPKDRS